MVPKTPARAGLQLDVGEELRAGRVQGLKHVAHIAELRARVTTLEAWRRSAESQRAALLAAVATAVITASGAVVVLLFNHHS